MATDVSVRIGVDGEKEFKTALSGIDSQLKNLNSEMKAVESSMEGLDDAESKAAKKSELLGKSMEATREKISLISNQYDRAREKLDQLGQELEDAKREFGENSQEALKAQNAYNRQAKAVNDLGTKLNNATADLNKMERELRDLDSSADRASSSLGDLGSAADDAGNQGRRLADSFKDAFLGGAVGGAISGMVQSLVSGIGEMVGATEEYRKIMGTLEVSSQHAGYTAQETAQSYQQLYGVLGDDQASATALANLQALGLSQGDLTTLIDGTIGAWAAYGDSIPIDSLAEAINETIQAGTVTGAFADVLNWAGQSEDEFNAKLRATQDPAERARMVLEELARQNLPELANAFREANPDIVAMNEAEAELQDATARLSEAIAPAAAAITQFKADLVNGVSAIVENLGPFAPLLAGAAAAIAGFVAVAAGGTILAALSSGVTILTGAFGALNAVMLANPIGLVVGLIAGLVAAFVTAYNSSETFRAAVNAAFSAIQNAVSVAIQALKTFVSDIGAAFVQLGTELAAAGQSVMNFFTQTVPSAIQSALSWFGQIPGKVASFLSSAISAIAAWASETAAKAMSAGRQALSAVASFFGQIPGTISGLLSQALSALVTWASNMAAKASAGMNQVKTTIVSTLQGIPSQIASVGRNIVQGLWNGISNAKGWLLGKIRSWCGSVLNGIKSFFGIASPSRVMRDQVGLMIARGLALGLQKGERQVLDMADALNKKLLAKENDLVRQLEDTGLDEATKTALNDQLTVVKEFRAEYEKALAEIQKSQDSMAKKLKEYGDLFEEVRTETGSFLKLSDLEEQIDGIRRYGDALESLKGRGISDGLMDEITSMDVDDAVAYTEKLLAMTDEEYTRYMALWAEKQEEAQKVASKFYQDELDALADEFVDKLPGELSDVKNEMRTIGVQSVQGMIDGLYSRSGALAAAMRSIVSQALAAARAAADIHSPSRKAAQLVGKPLAQGIEMGFLDTMDRVSRNMAAVMSQPFAAVTRSDLFDAASGMVNGQAALVGAGAGSQTIIIPVNLNGKQIAEVVYEPLKQVGRQRGK